MSTLLLGWAFSIMMNYMMSINLRKYKSMDTTQTEILDAQDKLKQFKNGLLRNFWLMIGLLILSVLFYTFFSKENWSWIDSLQFSVVTMSTVRILTEFVFFCLFLCWSEIAFMLGWIWRCGTKINGRKDICSDFHDFWNSFISKICE